MNVYLVTELRTDSESNPFGDRQLIGVATSKSEGDNIINERIKELDDMVDLLAEDRIVKYTDVLTNTRCYEIQHLNRILMVDGKSETLRRYAVKSVEAYNWTIISVTPNKQLDTIIMI